MIRVNDNVMVISNKAVYPFFKEFVEMHGISTKMWQSNAFPYMEHKHVVLAKSPHPTMLIEEQICIIEDIENGRIFVIGESCLAKCKEAGSDFVCPHCGAELDGRDTMYREVIVEDTDWLGIEDGEIIDCNTMPSQPDFGDILCRNCHKSIEEYIRGLIDRETLDEGELLC